MSGDLTRNEVMQMVVRVSLVSLATYFSVKWWVINDNFNFRTIKKSIFILRMLSQIDPTCKAKKKAKERAEGLLRR